MPSAPAVCNWDCCIATWNLYAPFRAREPIERVGRSFLMYDVTYPDPIVDRTIVLGPQASDLDTTTLGSIPIGS